MAHRKIQKNYEFFSNYDYYTPGPAGILILLLLLLAGAFVGGLVSTPVALFLKDNPDAMLYATLISDLLIVLFRLLKTSVWDM